MKKNCTRILCIAIVLMIALLPAMALAARGYRYVKTDNGGPLNVREEPRKSSKSICKLPYGAYVLIYSYSDNKTWAYIEADNPDGRGTVKGWVATSCLSRTDPGKYVPTKKEPTFGDVNSAAKALKLLEEPYTTVIKTTKPTNIVHLRWFPSTSACYLGEYLCGEEILVLAESKSWAQVQIVENGNVGFIVRSCVADVVEE